MCSSFCIARDLAKFRQRRTCGDVISALSAGSRNQTLDTITASLSAITITYDDEGPTNRHPAQLHATSTYRHSLPAVEKQIVQMEACPEHSWAGGVREEDIASAKRLQLADEASFVSGFRSTGKAQSVMLPTQASMDRTQFLPVACS